MRTLFVLTGPSGAGKGTLFLRYRETAEGVVLITSYTTRTPRPGETDGVEYFFVSKEAFKEMIKENALVEWTQYQGEYYGTPRKSVEDALQKGDVFLEVDCQGAIQIRENYPEAVLIFCMAPTFAELERRLRERGTESEKKIAGRLRKAEEEVGISNRSGLFNYFIITDEIEKEVWQLQQIRTKHSLLTSSC